mmetsp:Transcript_65889/g.140989  ORF Transcript_65889/g.140989 Transcript_65889/m.140989 type:complete len:209 (-) Transcript_65889:136-762(-)
MQRDWGGRSCLAGRSGLLAAAVVALLAAAAAEGGVAEEVRAQQQKHLQPAPFVASLRVQIAGGQDNAELAQNLARSINTEGANLAGVFAWSVARVSNASFPPVSMSAVGGGGAGEAKAAAALGALRRRAHSLQRENAEAFRHLRERIRRADAAQRKGMQLKGRGDEGPVEVEGPENVPSRLDITTAPPPEDMSQAIGRMVHDAVARAP